MFISSVSFFLFVCPWLLFYNFFLLCIAVSHMKLLKTTRHDCHYMTDAVLHVHEASEAYLVDMLEDTNLCTIHTKHVTNTTGHSVMQMYKG